MTDEPGQDPEAAAIAQQVKLLSPVITKLGRTDLVTRLRAASARVARPSTIVCVVGEFKKGKSSLVNGVLGMDVCPVDDDLATSVITLVRFGEEPSAVARLRRGDQVVSEKIAVEDVGTFVSEQGNPGNEQSVDRVDIAVPASVLKNGLSIVDTPGMGGLGAGHAAATLAFLPFADGLVFVSDASAELSQPEVDFLRQAKQLCPTVMLVLTKTDLYPEWRRIADLNKGHLARAGFELPHVSISNTLRHHALDLRERELNDKSGYPVVIRTLDQDVVRPARQNAAVRSRADITDVVGQVRTTLSTERAVLADPKRLKSTLKSLEETRSRLDNLRGPGARWTVLVGDRTADLTSTTSHDFRAAMRAVSRNFDEQIEELTTGEQWDALARDLQTQVAQVVADVFMKVSSSHQEIRDEVIALLADENLKLSSFEGDDDESIDVAEFWTGKAFDANKESVFKTALTTVRGGYGGMAMLGMLSGFLPKAAVALLHLNPVSLGIGAIFGGLQFLDDRKRTLTTRRQAARTQLRTFIDDVQFQVGDELTGSIREVQRDLRDEFTTRLTELQRTYTDAIKQTADTAERSQASAKERMREIDTALAELSKASPELAK